MTDQEFKDLLTAAEKEVGSTPGAYCSRKAAIRAMQLLLVPGQAQFTEMEKKLAHDNKMLDEFSAKMKEASATIQRQAEAIKRLETEKTQLMVAQGLAPKPESRGLLEKLRGSSSGLDDAYARNRRKEEAALAQAERARQQDLGRRQQMNRPFGIDPFDTGPTWKPLDF